MSRPRWTSWRPDVGVIQLTEYDEDSFLACQVDGFGEGATTGASAVHHPFGFSARADDPDADGGGCLAFNWNEGDKGHVIQLEDVRLATVIPAIAKGGSVQYCARGSFDEHSGSDGTKTIYVPYLDGVIPRAHLIQIGLDPNGDKVVNIQSGEGPRLTMKGKELTLANELGSEWICISPDGITLSGVVKVIGSLDVGSASFMLAKSAEVVAALQAIKICLTMGGSGGGAAPVVLNGAVTAAGLIDSAIATLSTTMTKGF